GDPRTRAGQSHRLVACRATSVGTPSHRTLHRRMCGLQTVASIAGLRRAPQDKATTTGIRGISHHPTTVRRRNECPGSAVRQDDDDAPDADTTTRYPGGNA